MEISEFAGAGRALRIHLHDNSGHPFQVQLSRALAANGHSVLHTYMASFQSPKGALAPQPGDAPTLRIQGVDLGVPFAKYSYVQRWRQERRYGAALADLIRKERPEVFIASNTPPEMLEVIQRTCRRQGVRFVFWVQDLYGFAMRQILGMKFGGLGRMIAAYYTHKEGRLLRGSDHAVAITEDFRPFLRDAGVQDHSITVIPNWAPLDEMPRRDRHNGWGAEHGLAGRFVFLYSGTLGLKHNPALLLALAEAFRNDPEVSVVVNSEGLGADWLRQAVAAAGLANLKLLPFQPFDRMPEVLASADVLLAMLEDSAGVFSVPSKILTYLCAGRPVLLGAPAANQAAKLIQDNGAGLVSPASQADAFIAAARRLRSDAELRRQMGHNGRNYAETRFQLEAITDRFEKVLRQSHN